MMTTMAVSGSIATVSRATCPESLARCFARRPRRAGLAGASDRFPPVAPAVVVPVGVLVEDGPVEDEPLAACPFVAPLRGVDPAT
jgi:hypothetical protein